MVYICASLLHLALESRDLSQTEKKDRLLQAEQLPKMTLKVFLGEKLFILSEKKCHFVKFAQLVTRV